MVQSFLGASNYHKNIYPETIFRERTEALFEGEYYPIPKDYDQLLTILYNDYMTIPPEEDRKCKQHAILVDLNRSYEEYAHYRDGMKFETLTRSIR